MCPPLACRIILLRRIEQHSANARNPTTATYVPFALQGNINKHRPVLPKSASWEPEAVRRKSKRVNAMIALPEDLLRGNVEVAKWAHRPRAEIQNATKSQSEILWHSEFRAQVCLDSGRTQCSFLQTQMHLPAVLAKQHHCRLARRKYSSYRNAVNRGHEKRYRA